MDEVRKAVDMGYGLVDVFEFWENKVTYFYRHHFRFFLQNKHVPKTRESSGYLSWVQSDDDKDKYIADYRRAEGIALDNASVLKNSGQRTSAKVKLNSMWGK